MKKNEKRTNWRSKSWDFRECCSYLWHQTISHLGQPSTPSSFSPQSGARPLSAFIAPTARLAMGISSKSRLQAKQPKSSDSMASGRVSLSHSFNSFQEKGLRQKKISHFEVLLKSQDFTARFGHRSCLWQSTKALASAPLSAPVIKLRKMKRILGRSFSLKPSRPGVAKVKGFFRVECIWLLSAALVGFGMVQLRMVRLWKLVVATVWSVERILWWYSTYCTLLATWYAHRETLLPDLQSLLQ